MYGIRNSRCVECGEEFVFMDPYVCARCLSVAYFPAEELEQKPEEIPKETPKKLPASAPVKRSAAA